MWHITVFMTPWLSVDASTVSTWHCYHNMLYSL